MNIFIFLLSLVPISLSVNFSVYPSKKEFLECNFKGEPNKVQWLLGNEAKGVRKITINLREYESDENYENEGFIKTSFKPSCKSNNFLFQCKASDGMDFKIHQFGNVKKCCQSLQDLIHFETNLDVSSIEGNVDFMTCDGIRTIPTHSEFENKFFSETSFIKVNGTKDEVIYKKIMIRKEEKIRRNFTFRCFISQIVTKLTNSTILEL